MSRSRDVLTLMAMCGLNLTIVSIQFYVWGYSLGFSKTADNQFIGNLNSGGLADVGAAAHPAAPDISELVYFVYQMQFAAITPALAFGSGGVRMRLWPLMVIPFIWSTIVYDPVVYAMWGLNGWLHTLGDSGAYDFAGGIAIHTVSGMTALAYGMLLRRPSKPGREPFAGEGPNHSPLLVYIGTALLWFGWIGFNAGSEGAANARAATAAINSNLAASIGGITWMLLDSLHTKKLGSIPFCCGVVAGLATITPGSGYVPVWASLIYGVLASLVCRTVVANKELLRIDVDTLDVFAVHGVGGMLGVFLTGIFASADVIALDGTVSPGGWVSQHYIQVPIQLAAIAYGAGYSFVVSFALLWIVDKIPGLHLRASEEDERAGLDRTQVGESAYDYYHALPLLDAERESVKAPLQSNGTPQSNGTSGTTDIELQKVDQ